MVVQELGWDDDVDDDLRAAIEDTIDADMVDGDYGNVVDAVLLWWRDDDGDLVDALVDSLTDLVGGGAIWLLTPKVGRPSAVDAADIAEAAPIAGLSHDHDRRGEQGLDRHPAGRPEDAALTRPGRRPDRAARTSTRARDQSPVRRPRRGPLPASASRCWPGRDHPALLAAGAGQDGAGRCAVGHRARPAASPPWRSARPDRVGLVDELGELTFGELHQRSNALAHALRELGVGEGDSVALMCRNHRDFVDASIAAAKLGADILYLNTAFAGPQLVEVLEREEPAVVVYDEEFTGCSTTADVERPGPRLATTATAERRHARGADRGRLDATTTRRRSSQPGSIILTSGHHRHAQGRPAQRGRHRRRRRAAVADAAAGTAGAPTSPRRCSTPGAGRTSALAMLLGSTIVLRRKFDPEDCLGRSPRRTCDSLVVIPVMLQRILQLPEETLRLLRPVDGQGRRRLRVGAARRPRRPTGWTSSATTSTTSTARPRSPTPPSPPRPTCARPRARPAGRRTRPS